MNLQMNENEKIISPGPAGTEKNLGGWWNEGHRIIGFLSKNVYREEEMPKMVG